MTIEDRIERIERFLIDQYDASDDWDPDLSSMKLEHQERAEEERKAFRERMRVSKELQEDKE